MQKGIKEAIIDKATRCHDEPNDPAFPWPVRAFMRWIVREPDDANDAIEGIMERLRTGENMAEKESLDRAYVWYRALHHAVSCTPAPLDYLFFVLSEHIKDKVGNYRPLRDFERQALNNLISGGVMEFLRNYDDDKLHGEFLNDLAGDIKRWLSLSTKMIFIEARKGMENEEQSKDHEKKT